MSSLCLSFYISLLPPAGDELHEQTGWKWIRRLQQRHVSAATHDQCSSHINFSSWVNPVTWLAICWVGLSPPNVPGSSRSASLATGTLPLATTWRRRRWMLAPCPLARHCFSLYDAPALHRDSSPSFLLAVFPGGHRHDVHPGLLLPGTHF